MIEYYIGEDEIPFQPYDNLNDNFMHWFVPYMDDVFYNQTDRNVKDHKLHNELIELFKTKNELKDLSDIIKRMSRNGFVGPKAYFNANLKFYDFLEHKKHIGFNKVSSAMLKDFLARFIDKSYSQVYKKNIFVAVKNFLMFIEDRNILEDGRTSHLFALKKDIAKAIKRSKKEIAFLSPHVEYYKFLDAIDKVAWHDANMHRNRLMLKILLITGIRVSELTAIKIDDVKVNSLENTVLIDIVGKGNKSRIVSIAHKLIKENLEATMLNAKGQGTKFLFPTKSGKAVNVRYLHDIIVPTMSIAGIPKKSKNSSHMLRHSCATWLSAVGKFDIVKIQAYMGHADISTTNKYIHIDSEVVKDVTRKANEILGNELNKLLINEELRS